MGDRIMSKLKKLRSIVREEILNEVNPEAEIYKKLDKITDQVFLLIGKYHHKVDR